MKCPICKKPVESNGPVIPFCSDRCRIIDLGNWAMDKYVVSSPADLTMDPSDLTQDLQENE